MAVQAVEASCFDLITAVDGLFCVEKRSETLNGSIPLRAAQGCKPLLDGNAAGFHLRPAVPALIRKTRSGLNLILPEKDYQELTRRFSAALERLVERGILAAGGPWHRALRNGIAWKKGPMLFLWTGHLVRPNPGVWMLVSGAWNRRCLVDLREYVIPGGESFVPLVLQLDLDSLRARDTWLDTELACLTPLRPGVAMSIRSLQEQPEPGRALCEFYDASYVERRADGEYVGKYRKVTAHEPSTESADTADCQLVVAGGPKLHRIVTFDRFATATGWTRTHPERSALQFALVRNICDVKGRWDGNDVRSVSAEMPEHVSRLRLAWTELYGADSIACIDTVCDYVLGNPGPYRAERFFSVEPWVLAVTPPGWSSLVDASHLKGLDGMRGLISTDSYFVVPPVWQFHEAGPFTIPRGVPLTRVLPVPRRLLRATFRNIALDDSAPAGISMS